MEQKIWIENNFTIIISLSLVFVLLIYIYPLRLLFSAFIAFITGGYFPSEFVLTTGNELTSLFVFYGVGFFAITSLLGLLNYYCLKINHIFKLNEVEILMTKFELWIWFTQSIVALTSSCIAFFTPIVIGQFSGFVYFLLPLLIPAISISFKSELKK